MYISIELILMIITLCVTCGFTISFIKSINSQDIHIKEIKKDIEKLKNKEDK